MKIQISSPETKKYLYLNIFSPKAQFYLEHTGVSSVFNYYTISKEATRLGARLTYSKTTPTVALNSLSLHALIIKGDDLIAKLIGKQ